MTAEEARRRLNLLIARNGGEGPELIGILIVTDDGSVAVSMDTADDTTITTMGVLARRKAGPVVVDRDGSVTPVLERPR